MSKCFAYAALSAEALRQFRESLGIDPDADELVRDFDDLMNGAVLTDVTRSDGSLMTAVAVSGASKPLYGARGGYWLSEGRIEQRFRAFLEKLPPAERQFCVIYADDPERFEKLFDTVEEPLFRFGVTVSPEPLWVAEKGVVRTEPAKKA